jgi:putative membrane protein
MMWGYGNAGGLGYGLGFGFGWLVMLVFWGLIIWAIIALVRSAANNNVDRKDEHKTDNALEILKERYAKGEITKEDFERIKKDLQ